MRINTASSVFLVVLLLSAVGLGQLPSSRCNASKSALEDCTFLTQFDLVQAQSLVSPSGAPDRSPDPPENSAGAAEVEPVSRGAAMVAAPFKKKEGFHWHRALSESFTFLVIEQAYVVHTDFNWVVSENGVPFNHFWRDYKQSLSRWVHSGWNDGDPNWFGYVGHPIQGALTGFIQIQNDPQGEKLEFSKTKAYWWSRFKATLWNTAYSMQWNLGPFSEPTVEKYGTKTRPPWNFNGTYPCSRHCVTGLGQIDIVMTPLGGAGWLIGEDFLDKKIVRGVEGATQNRLLIDTARCALNPIRGGANILHGKRPWYRASRDAEGVSLFSGRRAEVFAHETQRTQVPNHGDIFFGFSHMGRAHCQVPISGAAMACDPLSVKSSKLSGWNVSVEKKYLRYFGAVADFSGGYGAMNQRDFLFGLRGGAWIGRLRPFAQALFGAVHANENGALALKSDTTFAEDLGGGVDLRLMRMLSWRIQADEIKTGASVSERRNLRFTSGVAVHF
jgi:hypothetical protein